MILYILKSSLILTNLFTNTLLCLNSTWLIIEPKIKLELSSSRVVLQPKSNNRRCLLRFSFIT